MAVGLTLQRMRECISEMDGLQKQLARDVWRENSSLRQHVGALPALLIPSPRLPPELPERQDTLPPSPHGLGQAAQFPWPMDDSESAATDPSSPLVKWELLVGALLASTSPELAKQAITELPLELAEVWQGNNIRGRAAFQKRSHSETSGKATSRAGDVLTESGMSRFFILHPYSRIRLVWGLIGILSLGYEVFTIPFFIAFELTDSKASFVLSCIMSVYWLIDLAWNFFIGFQDGVVIEMRLRRVVMNYAKGWFFPDLVIVLIDAAVIATDELNVGDSHGMIMSTKSVRIARILRFLRVLRLFRVRKLKDVSRLGYEFVKTEYLILVGRISELVAFVLIVNHWIACAWHAIGIFNHHHNTWVIEYDLDGQPIAYRYAMSLHWSLTQFTPATNNIAPQNLRERGFAICTVVFAFMFFSSIIAGVSNAVNMLRELSRQRIKAESDLKKFLLDRNVSTKLATRIHQFFREHYKAPNTRVFERDLPFFSEFPESLRIRIHDEVFMPVLSSYVIFAVTIPLDRAGMSKVCHLAMSEKVYKGNQDVFIDHIPATTTYVVLSGELIYCSAFMSDSLEVVANQWVSEAALWLRWWHRGQLIAESLSDLVLVDITVFRNVLLSTGGPLVECLKKVAIFFLHQVEKLAECARLTTDMPLENDVLTSIAKRSIDLLHVGGRNSVVQSSLDSGVNREYL